MSAKIGCECECQVHGMEGCDCACPEHSPERFKLESPEVAAAMRAESARWEKLVETLVEALDRMARVAGSMNEGDPFFGEQAGYEAAAAQAQAALRAARAELEKG